MFPTRLAAGRWAVIAGAVCCTAALAAPAGAKTAPRGVNYGGQTTAGDPIVIRLSKDGTKVAGVAEEFEAKCASGKYLNSIAYVSGSLHISPTGAFSGMHDGSPTSLQGGFTAHQLVTYKGRVVGRRLTGSLAVSLAVTDASGAQVDTCSRRATFTTTATKGKTYAGLTSQRAPVVIELNASGAAVHHFHIGWRSTCTPEGGFQVGDTLTNFGVAKGVFGDSFSINFGEPGQEQEFNDYSVRGKLTKAKATGAFRVKTRDVSATGGTEADCDSGAITFTAATG